MTTEDPSLSAYGYQLLPIATSQLVDNNREFDILDIFQGVLSIVGWGELMTTEDPSLSAHGYQLLPIATVIKWLITGNLMYQTYFEVFYSFFVEGSLWP